MVYLSEHGHPSQYQPGLTLINFIDQTNELSQYAMAHAWEGNPFESLQTLKPV